MTNEEIDRFSSMLKQANNVVVFTGAGISTESGIPDFRGPSGVWKTQRPINFNDFIASEDVRRLSWQRKFSNEHSMDGAQPNSGHEAISSLVKMEKVTTIITQNVDGLHQKSGVPDRQIIEIHGNANYATCLDCDKRYELQDIAKEFQLEEKVPYCSVCQGMIKTATISFGQAMPIKAMEEAHEACVSADLLLVLGSSLSVYPAAGLPHVALQSGAVLVLINNEETELDSLFNLVLHHPIGETLSTVLRQISD
ncbi:MAG: NAD-dependent deacetylase [Candidatus Azotimanducaceae bacterium]|jgi:NAD-dependent deacetylase